MPGTKEAPANALPQTVTILIGGAPLDKLVMFKVLEARVSLARSMAGRCVIRFEDREFYLIDDAKFAIGKPVEIKFSNYTGSPTSVFKGEITALGSEQAHGATHEFVLEAYDKSHRLGHVSRVRTFLKMNYGDMVSKIASEAGLTATVDLPKNKFEYTMQNSTDFAFLDTIAWRTGTEWFVEGDKLTFQPRQETKTVALKLGHNLRRFRARYSGSEHVMKATVRAWDPTTKRAIKAEDSVQVKNPPNASRPKLAIKGRTGAGEFGSTAFTTGAVVAETQNEADMLVDALGARQATSELIVKGEALGLPTLTAGSMIEVESVGLALGGKYYLTEVEHVFGGKGDLVTRFTAGGQEPSALVDLLGSSASEVGHWGKEGLVVGIVTNNKDPEGLSRVKVKFPTLSDDQESNWARIVSVGAGGGRGWHMIPEINDEVVVGFEHGDLRRPFVLGSVWNTKDKPPMKNDEVVGTNVGSWTIKTRQGLVLGLLDGDAPDKKAMSLVLSDGKTKLIVAEDKIQVISDKKPIELNTGQSSIVMADNGDITIKGNNVNIEAKMNVKIEAKSNVEAKASVGMKLEGQATFEAKGGGTAKVEASGVLTLKGATAMIN